MKNYKHVFIFLILNFCYFVKINSQNLILNEMDGDYLEKIKKIITIDSLNIETEDKILYVDFIVAKLEHSVNNYNLISIRQEKKYKKDGIFVIDRDYYIEIIRFYLYRKDSIFRWKLNDDGGPNGICFYKFSNKVIVKNNYDKLINYIKNDYPIIFIKPILLGDD